VTSDRERPGLYVHLPFCRSICPYCDFYVLTGDATRRQEFASHLSAEIGLCERTLWPEFVDGGPTAAFDTLYFGGGTPSRLASDDLTAVCQSIADRLAVAEDLWIGLEANPEDATPRNLAAWKTLGVRFLSLGVQSFDPRVLSFLGREHTPGDCLAAARHAGEAGFDTLSLDLIFGLPDQSDDDWRRELEIALSLEPDHLSCYQLTIEPRTPFGFRQQRGQLVVLAADRQADLFLLTHRWLEDHGFEAYEVSSFAVGPEHRSRHNSKYWRHTPYLGLGPSAHSFAGRQRWWNHRKIRPWQSDLEAGRRPIDNWESLTRGQLQLERLMLGLRQPTGIDLGDLPGDVDGQIWETNRDLIEELHRAELITIRDRRLLPTLSGLAVAEAMAGRFALVEP
jgi:oxygen-independent coproporphyrinogen-3 oxidase